ncbi:hypothetical protein QUB80_11690 [Chlorogloeopsis sp. ULAP01]|uniref:hypothetical protein n=1 Tax=Chlorogloeopsis sp. ULAP01 TaxID=3056483 RepID=UPI0025AAE928|nr:hypothetical protein [Chlorogloeopsis sp. ULAP01]MDM9381365.1 hypothetical protein [Chlorogloeopsis sp. ULAP01]
MRREHNLAVLPQVDSPMFTPTLGTSADLAITLLIHYSFDLSGYGAAELVERWQNQYPDGWLHLAVIEALYQGRYKAISVQQILTLWQRRDQPSFHFNMEFERLICSKFPENLTSFATPSLNSAHLHEQRYQASSSPQLPSYQKHSSGHLQTEESRYGKGSSTLKLPTPLPPVYHSPSSDRQAKLLPPAVNHPPIQQFTPQWCDRSTSFTEKLKAIAQEENQDENNL